MFDGQPMVMDPFTELLDRVAGPPGQYRSARDSHRGISERLDQPAQPVGMDNAIRVGERDDIARRLAEASIARGGRTSRCLVKYDGPVAVGVEYGRGAVARGLGAGRGRGPNPMW